EVVPCRATMGPAARQPGLSALLDEEVAEILRMQLLWSNACQGDMDIANRDHGIAVVLPNRNVMAVQLSGVVESQLVHPGREVGNGCVSAAVSKGEGIRAPHARHCLDSAGCHEDIGIGTADKRVGSF